MLFLSLIVGLAIGALLYRKNLRLEGASDTASETAVHASVDGKRVESYIKD